MKYFPFHSFLLIIVVFFQFSPFVSSFSIFSFLSGQSNNHQIKQVESSQYKDAFPSESSHFSISSTENLPDFSSLLDVFYSSDPSLTSSLNAGRAALERFGLLTKDGEQNNLDEPICLTEASPIVLAPLCLSLTPVNKSRIALAMLNCHLARANLTVYDKCNEQVSDNPEALPSPSSHANYPACIIEVGLNRADFSLYTQFYLSIDEICMFLNQQINSQLTQTNLYKLLHSTDAISKSLKRSASDSLHFHHFIHQHWTELQAKVYEFKQEEEKFYKETKIQWNETKNHFHQFTQQLNDLQRLHQIVQEFSDWSQQQFQSLSIQVTTEFTLVKENFKQFHELQALFRNEQKQIQGEILGKQMEVWLEMRKLHEIQGDHHQQLINSMELQKNSSVEALQLAQSIANALVQVEQKMKAAFHQVFERLEAIWQLDISIFQELFQFTSISFYLLTFLVIYMLSQAQTTQPIRIPSFCILILFRFCELPVLSFSYKLITAGSQFTLLSIDYSSYHSCFVFFYRFLLILIQYFLFIWQYQSSQRTIEAPLTLLREQQKLLKSVIVPAIQRLENVEKFSYQPTIMKDIPYSSRHIKRQNKETVQSSAEDLKLQKNLFHYFNANASQVDQSNHHRLNSRRSRNVSKSSESDRNRSLSRSSQAIEIDAEEA
jgi:hypothetical protein